MLHEWDVEATLGFGLREINGIQTAFMIDRLLTHRQKWDKCCRQGLWLNQGNQYGELRNASDEATCEHSSRHLEVDAYV